MRPFRRNDISRNDRSWKPSWPDSRTVGVRQARPPPLPGSRRTLLAGPRGARSCRSLLAGLRGAQSCRTLLAEPRGAQSCRSLPVSCPPHQCRLKKEDHCPGCWRTWRPGFGDRRPAANGKAPRQGRLANHVSFRLPAVSLEILRKGRLQVLLIDSNYGMRSLPLKNMSTH
jgi:hypothetical protein